MLFLGRTGSLFLEARSISATNKGYGRFNSNSQSRQWDIVVYYRCMFTTPKYAIFSGLSRDMYCQVWKHLINAALTTCFQCTLLFKSHLFISHFFVFVFIFIFAPLVFVFVFFVLILIIFLAFHRFQAIIILERSEISNLGRESRRS